MDQNAKLAAIRAAMCGEQVDLLMLTTEDAYLAESAETYWRTLRWLTGFPGTLAYALVTAEKFAFFTDSRYVEPIRRLMQIEGAEVLDVTVCGADYYQQWIKQELAAMPAENLTMAVDGRTITCAKAALLQETLAGVAGKTVRLRSDLDLLDQAWADRPAPSYRPIFEHELRYAGLTRTKKVSQVRTEMQRRGADHYIVGTMEAVAWLTNLRGQDIINPLFMSHALVTEDTVELYAKIEMIPGVLRHKLYEDGFTLFDIDVAADRLAQATPSARVYYDPYRTNFRLMDALPAAAQRVTGFDIINDLKAIKNPLEIENFKDTNWVECATLVRFYKFLKEELQEHAYTEYELHFVLEALRQRNSDYICNGCAGTTIIGYMANGAIPPYHPVEETALTVKPAGILVVDAVAHYYGGTTDITRTLALGPLGELGPAMRRDYTLVLKALMALTRQRFRKGADGAYLDSVCRSVLWNHHLHYGHGTGHGIGYCIAAHEGPQFIAEPSYKKEWAFCFLPLLPDMVMSFEPGVYHSGQYGVRLEDNLLIVEDTINEFGEWYKFETMSYCPFDPELVEVSLLHDDELAWFNAYQAETYRRLSPLLNRAEREFLQKMTAPLSR